MSSDFHFPTERVFFEMAEAHYQEALLHAGKVRRRIAPRRYRSFDGFPTDDGLGFAIAAIVSWATAIEASVNHLYSRHVILKMKSGPQRRLARQNVNTVSRLKRLLREASIKTSQLSWWPDVVHLFHFRDELVQLKEPTTGDTMVYAPIFRMKLSEDLLEDACMTASLTLAKLGEVYDVPTAYLNKGPLGLMLNRPESCSRHHQNPTAKSPRTSLLILPAHPPLGLRAPPARRLPNKPSPPTASLLPSAPGQKPPPQPRDATPPTLPLCRHSRPG